MTNLLTTNEYRFLQLVHFRNWINWDVKSYAINTLQSEYAFVKLSEVLQEQTRKVKLKDFPDTEFGILGVNNKVGVFDAYLEKGAKINQPYKKMQTNWIAYNPYRVNVGSIGIKTANEHYEYISNAYVVFSCDESKLDTEFFFRLFKTATFNNLVKKSTKGSVRQNLSFELLSNISIPLPPLHIQKTLVKAYEDKLTQVAILENKADTLDKHIESYLMQELGITIEEKQKKKGLQMIRFKDLDRWDTEYLLSQGLNIFSVLEKAKFEPHQINSIYKQSKQPFNKKNQQRDTFNYIELGSINENGVIYSTEEIVVNKAPSRATQIVHTGDYIIGTTRPYLKKFTIINEIFNDFVCSSAFYVVKPSQKYNLHYLDFVLRSQIGVKQFEYFMTGALYPAITSGELEKVLIPLPPLKIQNKIADQIDAWKKEIKTKKEQAEAIKQQAKEVFEKSLFETK